MANRESKTTRAKLTIDMSRDRKIAINDLKNKSKRKQKFSEISTILEISELHIDETRGNHLNELQKDLDHIYFENISRTAAYSNILERLDIDHLTIIPMNYHSYPSFNISMNNFIKNIDYIFFSLDDDLHICEDSGNLILSVVGDRGEYLFLEFTIFLPKSFS